MKEKLREYNSDPFAFFDNLKPSFRGRIFNPFIKFRLNRRLALLFAVFLGAVPWLLFGFDSCIAQPLMCLYRLPSFFLGHITFSEWASTWNEYYGKEMHYSAFLIYGLAYWVLSRHYDVKLGITKSKNVAFTLSLTLFSVAIFEWFWIYSYAHFQAQPWVMTFKFPQARIILQNLAFSTLGVLGTLYFWLDSYVYNPVKRGYDRLYKFRLDWKAALLVSVTVGLALLWVYYPFYVQQIEVHLETGEVWSSSTRFPQTLYTIDLNPIDGQNAGVWFFVENNWVHGLNTLVKAMLTVTVCYVGMVKEVKSKDG